MRMNTGLQPIVTPVCVRERAYFLGMVGARVVRAHCFARTRACRMPHLLQRRRARDPFPLGVCAEEGNVDGMSEAIRMLLHGHR